MTDWMSITANLALAVIWALFLNKTLSAKFGKRVTILGCAGVIAVFLVISLFIPQRLQFLKGIVPFLEFGICAIIFFKDKPLKKLLIIGLLLTSAILCELCASTLARQIAGGVDQLHRLPAHALGLLLASYVCMEGLLLECIAQLLNRQRKSFPQGQIQYFVLFPFSQFFLISILLWYMLGVDLSLVTVFLLIGIALCVVADVTLFRAIQATARKARLETEQVYLQRQIHIQERHGAQLEEQGERVAKMQRQIQEQMQTIQRLLEEPDPQEAAEYAAALLPQYARDQGAMLCPNSIVEALLLYKKEEAKEKGIGSELLVDWPEDCSISNVDMVCALSNLYDNAIEACVGNTDAVISLRIAPYGSYLAIRAENPLPVCQKAKKGEERGIGFYILRDIAAKYAGSFLAEPRGGQFCAELTLRMPTEGKADTV